MPKKDTALKIIPLGGLDGIGKNMTAFEYGDDMVLVDAGLMFPEDDQPGIDLILPDYTYVLENEHKLRGIVITHGHEDHTGALPYLLMDLTRKVPIYAAKLTLGMIAGKLEEHNIRQPKFVEVQDGSNVTLGALNLTFFAMTHSIPGALGVFMNTPAGTLIHTGDFKLDQTPIDGRRPNYQAICKFGARGVDLLLADSTNATRPGFTQSEAAVGPNLRHIIKNAKGRVFVASFSSHIHRLQQVCDASVAVGRKVVVTGRSMVNNTKVARELGYLNIADEDIIDAFDVDRIDRPDMDACTDGVMRAVWLREPLEWYKAPGHRYGCSGIDGTGFGPMFGAPDGSKEYLFIACGIYGDPSRTDNDHQLLLCYDVDGWDALAQPLSQASPHTSGPARADGVYFVYTGNTTYGVQNLEYDAFSRRWFMAVYPGRKPDYPNPPLFALDASRPPVRARLHGLDEEGMTLSLDGRGQRGYDFPWGSTGLYAFGDGRYYVSHEGRTPEGDTSEVVLYRWDGEAPFAEAGE